VNAPLAGCVGLSPAFICVRERNRGAATKESTGSAPACWSSGRYNRDVALDSLVVALSAVYETAPPSPNLDESCLRPQA
jgi:hypothetical protein